MPDKASIPSASTADAKTGTASLEGSGSNSCVSDASSNQKTDAQAQAKVCFAGADLIDGGDEETGGEIECRRQDMRSSSSWRWSFRSSRSLSPRDMAEEDGSAPISARPRRESLVRRSVKQLTMAYRYSRGIMKVDGVIMRKVIIPLALAATNNAICCIAFLTIISIAIPCISVLTGSFYVDNDGMSLWAPRNGPARRDSEWVDRQQFGAASSFPKRRITSMIIHTDSPDDNILSVNGINHVYDAIQAIQRTDGYRAMCIDIPRQYMLDNPSSANVDENIGETGDANTTLASGDQDFCIFVGVTRFWGLPDNRAAFEEYIESVAASIDKSNAGSEGADAYVMNLINQDLSDTISQEYFPDGWRVPQIRIFSPSPVHASTASNEEAEKQAQSSLSFLNAYKIELFVPYVLEEEKYMNLDAEITDEAEALDRHWVKTGADVTAQQAGSEGHVYRCETITTTTITMAVTEGMLKDVPLAGGTFVLMGIISTLIFTRFGKHKVEQSRFVHSSGILGLGAMITIMLSIMAGYGISSLFQLPFTSLTLALPIIIFGIGLDDAFIIWGAYERQLNEMTYGESKNVSMEGLVEEIITATGMTILTTTMTNVAAFGIGALCDIPAIRWMCIYAAITIFVDFVYQITFFMALVSLNHRRILNRRYDCLFCVKHRPDDVARHGETSATGVSNFAASSESDEDNNLHSSANSVSAKEEWNRMDQGLGDLHGDRQPLGRRSRLRMAVNQDFGDVKDAVSRALRPSREPENRNTDPDVDVAEQPWTNQVIDTYIEILLHPITKVLVLMGFAVLFAMAVWSATQIEKLFDYTMLTPKGSYADQFLEAEPMYSPTALAGLSNFYFRDIDVSDPSIQKQMYDFIDDMVHNHPFVVEPPATFWLTDFLAYRNETDADMPGRTFNEALDDFLSIESYGRVHTNNLVRNPTTGEIEASRTAFMYNITMNDSKSQERIYVKQLEIAARQPLNQQSGDTKMFTSVLWYHIWAHFVSIDAIVTRTLVAGLIAILIVTGFALPHPSGPFLAVAVTAMVDVCIVGVIPWAGFALNSLTVVFVVMAVGFAVDFNVHLIHGYLNAPNQNADGSVASREDRVRHVLQRVGGSVLLGGTSSLIAFCALALSSSPVFWQFFVILISLVLFGMGYGLAFLPVLLTYIGPYDLHMY